MTLDPYRFMLPFYDAWSAHMTDDIPFYVRHATAVAGPVVELGAGNGRVTIEVARAGQHIIGVEVSDAMRVDGVRRAAEAGVADRARFVQGDMRTWVAAEPVDLVIIPFRSFQHLLTTDDQFAALDCIRRSLRPGGRLIFNAFSLDPEKVVQFEGVPRLQTEFTDEAGRRAEAWATSTNRLGEQRLDVAVELRVFDGERLIATAEDVLRLRTLGRYEAEHLLRRAGFTIDTLYGGFDERPFGPGPDEMIWIARRDDE